MSCLVKKDLQADTLQITNSAPDHSVLGRLNGLAQTLSAAGRALGPLISGSLFSLTMHVQPKGEALAFGVFAGISFVGFLISFGIRGTGLETDEEDVSRNDGDRSRCRRGCGADYRADETCE